MSVQRILLIFALVSPCLSWVRLHADTPASPEKSASRSIVSVEISELPGTVHVKLGRLPAGVTTTKTVHILNRTDETILVRSSRSDCGCMVGIVPENPVAPGEKLSVGLKVKPTLQSRSFKRKLVLVQEEGSNRVIELLVEAESIPVLTASKRTLRFDLERKETIDVTFKLSFEREFDEPTIVGSEGSLLRWTRKTWNKKQAVFTATPVSSPEWNSGLVLTERTQIRVNDDLAATIVFLAEPRGVYQIRPSKFQLNRFADDASLRFFVVGDFESFVNSNDKVNIRLQAHDGSEHACKVSWKSSRLAVCTVSVSRVREFDVNEEIDVVLVSRSSRGLRLGTVSFSP